MGIDFSRPIFSPTDDQTWPPLLTIAQAAQILNVTPWTLRQWDKRGKFVPVRIGSRKDRRYKREDVLEIIEKGLK